ncbi:hypothetical protein C8Q76DRAFT_207212 [Earliella scabrosa]|nr:hypothetical protein C8Q76DRAFT_207212 [Earliella scabrosa]
MLRKLEHFEMRTDDVGLANSSLLNTLSSLPRLTHIAFGVTLGEDVLLHPRPGLHFGGITSLALSNITHPDELRVFHASRLYSLSVHHAIVDGVSSTSCFETLKFIGDHYRELRSLEWKLLNSYSFHFVWDAEEQPDLLASSVRPLLNLTSLETLSLDFNWLRLEHSDLVVIAESVPRVTTLTLAFPEEAHDYYYSRMVCSRTLRAIARSCPALTSLRLGAARIDTKELNDSHHPRPLDHPLHVLRIQSLQCPEPVFGAWTLDWLFPRLSVPELGADVVEDDCTRGSQWPEVLNEMERLRAARERWRGVFDELESRHAVAQKEE